MGTAAEKLARIEANNPWLNFVPNGRLRQFVKKVGNKEAFIFLLSAGNGFSKTSGMMNILANIVWGAKNPHFQGLPLFEKWPFLKRGRIVTEVAASKEIGPIDQEMQKWWPKGRWAASKDGKLYNSLIKTDSGWVFDKMTYEQQPKEFEGANLGLLWFDEPPPKPIFDASLARLREGGIVIITMTPICESPEAQMNVVWIFEELVDSADEDVFIMYGDVEDNCKEHGIDGHLSHENVDKILKRYPASQREARKTGKPQHFSNAIFGNVFNRDVHIIKDDVVPPLRSQCGMTVDPADGKPYAIVWWWVDPRGHIVIDREWPEDDWVKLVKEKPKLPKMSEYIPIFEKMESGRHMEWRIMDRHFGNNRNVRTGKTLIEDWRDQHKIDFQMSYDTANEMETGILKVQEYLAYDKDEPLGGNNLPRLYVKERCKNTIKALEKWTRKVDPVLLVAAPDPKSPYKDFCDVVRYTCMAQPEVYIPRPFVQNQPSYVLGR